MEFSQPKTFREKVLYHLLFMPLSETKGKSLGPIAAISPMAMLFVRYLANGFQKIEKENVISPEDNEKVKAEKVEMMLAAKKAFMEKFGHYTNLGPLIGIFDYPQLFHISNIANRMGFDCITFGWILAMMMECYQRGIITKEDTQGMELNWGDVELVEELMKKS